MDTDIGDPRGNAQSDQRLEDDGAAALCIKNGTVWQCGAPESYRNRVPAGVARLQTLCVIVRMRCGGMVLVGGEAVLMLWVVVIGVDVRVQRRHLAGS